MKRGLKLKIGDIVLMSAILLLALLLLALPFLGKRATTAQIVNAASGETQIIPLYKDAVYEIVSCGVTLNICVSNGEVFVSESDCADRVCKNTPPISRAGQSIACAPAGVIIKIVGEGEVVDGVSG